MRLNWLGTQFSDLDSYGRYSNGMIRALQGLGVDVQPLLGDAVTMPAWMVQQQGIDWSCLTISCMAALYAQPAPVGTRHWLLSMWETDQLPAHLGENVNECNFERVIVPCEAVAEAFRRGGVTAPIHIIPGGIDPDEFPLRTRAPANPYTFMAMADRASRKGWLEVWKAFYQAFGPHTTGRQDVRLMIKCRKGGNDAVTGLMHAENRDPRIVFQTDDVASSADMYAQADCFVFPSRFEGWGLPPREAACMGIPVITQAYSGMDDGHTHEWAIVVEGGQMQTILDPDDSMIVGAWRKCDVNELAAAMQACYDKPESAASLGWGSAAWLREHQTWTHSSLRLLELINEYSVLEPQSVALPAVSEAQTRSIMQLVMGG